MNSQTQWVNKACLPTVGGKPIESKKADFALSFSPQHPEISQQYAALRTPGQEPFALSQMNDISTSKLVLFIGAEVKKLGGNEAEAKAQLFNWLGAGVIKMRKLVRKINYTAVNTLPQLGWTIVGHDWKLYMAIGRGNKAEDEISIIGPLQGYTVDTTGFLGAFKLLRLMENIKQWAKEQYWSWYVKTIIDPLKGLTKSPEEAAEDEEIEEGDVSDA